MPSRPILILRATLFQVYLFTATLLYSILSVAVYPFDQKDRHYVFRVARHWSKSNVFFLKHICKLEVRLQGTEHLPSEPCIIASKHQSAWETTALMSLLPGYQSWVMKQELMRIPFFGWALRCSRNIFLDRSTSKESLQKLLNSGTASLQAGWWIMIFPEGTRVPVNQCGTYSRGVALLAKQNNVAIIPVAHNAGVFWGRRQFIKYPGTIDLVLGPAIVPQNRNSREITQELQDWIESAARKLPGGSAYYPALPLEKHAIS